MRAARFFGPSSPVRIEEVPYPAAGRDEVVIDVAACGICRSDLHFLDGMPPLTALPMTLGHEPAGVVAVVGPNVDDWAVGDRVAITLGDGCGLCRTCVSGHPNSCPAMRAPGLHTDGAFADAVAVPASSLVPVPDGVSLAAAAVATDSVATPYHALTCRADLQPGEHVAVIGVGGIGTQAVVFASHLGAERIVAVDRSEAALERAEKAGATDLVHVAAGRDPSASIRAATAGGPDVVVECVGAPETVAAGIRSLIPGGRLAIVGVGMQPPAIDLPQAIFSLAELTVFGSFASHKEDLLHILNLQAEGILDIESSISHRLTLDDVPEGLSMLREGTGDPQRIVVELGA